MQLQLDVVERELLELRFLFEFICQNDVTCMLTLT